MEAWLLIVVLLLVGAGVVMWWRRKHRAALPRQNASALLAPPRATAPLPGPQVHITLDVTAVDHGNPAVQRLVREAASRVFQTSPEVEAVIVEDRAGTRLGIVERDHPLPSPTSPPQEIPKPGGRRSRHSSASAGTPGTAGAADHDPAPHRSLADRFDLPNAVRAQLRRPDDPVDIVRAILEAAGLPVEVRGNMVLSSGHAVIVLAETEGAPSEALSDAFLRFQKSGASQGVVIIVGYVGRDIERRQALAPNLRYTGLSAVQRMADAVALGANPLAFATHPAIVG